MSNILQINQRDYVGNDLGSNVIVNDLYDYQEIDITVQENERGPRGIGIPQGGNPGQILVKNSQEDFSVVWQDKPVANDGTLTIQKNGSTVQTFTANSDVNKTANIEVPTKTSQITNDSGFITNSALNNYATKQDITVSLDDYTFDTSQGFADFLIPAIGDAFNDVYNSIGDIQEKIPEQATASNKLADKAFVNSSVQTATANFRGNWDDWADVPTVATDYPVDYAGNKTPTVNDYLVVQDASDYTLETLEGTWRFKYTGTWATDGKNGWQPEYQVNETPLTAEQLAALNSGITANLVANIPTGALANVAYSGSYNDLSNTPNSFLIRSALSANTNLSGLQPGIYPVNNIAHADFPVAGAMYGTLIQYPDTYKTQVLVAGEAAGGGNENNMYYRRWLTSTSSFTSWASAQVTVDSALNSSSTNPVQNQALYPAIVPTEIYKTVYTYDWTGPAGTNLYDCVAIITMPSGTFTNNSLIELVNEDSFNVFAQHGFVLYGSEVSSQRLWITSIGKPTGTVSLKFRIYKWGD